MSFFESANPVNGDGQISASALRELASQAALAQALNSAGMYGVQTAQGQLLAPPAIPPGSALLKVTGVTAVNGLYPAKVQLFTESPAGLSPDPAFAPAWLYFSDGHTPAVGDPALAVPDGSRALDGAQIYLAVPGGGGSAVALLGDFDQIPVGTLWRCHVLQYVFAQDFFFDVLPPTQVWARFSDGYRPRAGQGENGDVVMGLLDGTDSAGVPIYLVGKAQPGTVTVQDDLGQQSVGSTSVIQLGPAASWTISSPASGAARGLIKDAAYPGTAGLLNNADQVVQGRKRVTGLETQFGGSAGDGRARVAIDTVNNARQLAGTAGGVELFNVAAATRLGLYVDFLTTQGQVPGGAIQWGEGARSLTLYGLGNPTGSPALYGLTLTSYSGPNVNSEQPTTFTCSQYRVRRFPLGVATETDGANLENFPCSSITVRGGIVTDVQQGGGRTPDGKVAANLAFAGPASGASALPGFRALTTADLPDLKTVAVTSFNGRQGATVLSGLDVTLALGYADIARLGAGNIFTAANTFTRGALLVKTGADGNKGLVVRRNSGSQTASLVEIQDESANVLCYVDPFGILGAVHLAGTTPPPSVAPAPGAGANATATLTGTDASGTITLTTSVLDTPAANAVMCTVTFDAGYAAAPVVLLVPANDAAWNLTWGVVRLRQADVTTLLFTLRSGPTPLPATTAAIYSFNYVCVQ